MNSRGNRQDLIENIGYCILLVLGFIYEIIHFVIYPRHIVISMIFFTINQAIRQDSLGLN